MYICYLDESGTPAGTDSSGHFVLVGLAVMAQSWKHKDREIDAIKVRYGLAAREVHTAWMLREYPEQQRVPGFESLSFEDRARQVLAVRTQNLARSRSPSAQRMLQATYRKTADYIHLSREERRRCVTELADLIGGWQDAKLFAEAQQKRSSPDGNGDFEEAFEQVVTRFNRCLSDLGGIHGLLVQDNNDTVAHRLTELMRKFHRDGTTWSRNIEYVVETPMFVDSQLTSMVQLADLCAYAIRRFFDNDESDLLDRIAPAFHRNAGKLVGLRHFTRADGCTCRLCLEHGRRPARPVEPAAPTPTA